MPREVSTKSDEDHLPIFLLIFGLPAAAAVVLKWKFI
jgi:hypothetical protein